MVNQGFGQFDAAQLQQLAQQYWGQWAQLLQQAASGAQMAAGNPFAGVFPQASGFATPFAMPFAMPTAPTSGDMFNSFGQWLHQQRQEADQALGKFSSLAQQWYAQMQQVAAQFAEQGGGSARDIVDAWKKALGASSENPFPEIFRTMRGNAMPGMSEFMADASPYLDSVRSALQQQLSLPTFGLLREHQEQWQALLRADMDYRHQAAAFNALLAKAGQQAFELFEEKLNSYDAADKKIESARALFDVWVDAAEEAYARVALSAEYSEAYGALVNAQMRLRQQIQVQIERICQQWGLPTRSEVDAAHRKIAQLQRTVRALQAQLNAQQPMAPLQKPQPTPAAAKPSQPHATTARNKPAASAAKSASKPAVKKPAKQAAKPADRASAKAASKPAVAAKAASKTVQKAASASKRSANIMSGIPMPKAPAKAKAKGANK